VNKWVQRVEIAAQVEWCIVGQGCCCRRSARRWEWEVGWLSSGWPGPMDASLPESEPLRGAFSWVWVDSCEGNHVLGRPMGLLMKGRHGFAISWEGSGWKKKNNRSLSLKGVRKWPYFVNSLSKNGMKKTVELSFYTINWMTTTELWNILSRYCSHSDGLIENRPVQEPLGLLRNSPSAGIPKHAP
jgi:hypothetical protein